MRLASLIWLTSFSFKRPKTEITPVDSLIAKPNPPSNKERSVMEKKPITITLFCSYFSDNGPKFKQQGITKRSPQRG